MNPDEFLNGEDFDVQTADEFTGGGDFDVEEPTKPAPVGREKQEMIAANLNPVQNFGVGLVKGAGSTVLGMGQLGQKIAQQTAGRVLEKVTGKAKESFGAPVYAPGTESNTKLRDLVTPAGTAQNIGYTTEKIAEFLAPSRAVAGVTARATAAIPGTGLLSGLGRAGTKAAIEGIATGGVATLQEGEINDDVKTTALVGSAFSLGGSVLSGAGKILKSGGEKILYSKIRPGIKEVRDGFDIGSLKKYGIGGNLDDMNVQTQKALNARTSQLNEALKGSDAAVNPYEAFQRTMNEFGGSRAKTFGDNRAIRRVLDGLRGELDEVIPQMQAPTRVGALERVTETTSKTLKTPPPTKMLPVGAPTKITKVPINPSGKPLPKRMETLLTKEIGREPGETLYTRATDLRRGVKQTVEETTSALKPKFSGATDLRYPAGSPKISLYDATLIKRGAGTKGAWSFGRVDPDASAVEEVYSAFYRHMREIINKNAPEAVANLNKEISDLIPVSNAIIRRMPVEARNNAISLTDNMALLGSVFDPRALALYGANRLSKSGKFANFLLDAADRLENPKSAIGQRLLGAGKEVTK